MANNTTKNKTAEKVETAAEVKNETKVETAAEEKEKMVKIRLPRTRENAEDVFISVNNRTWQVQRGVEVELPECAVEVLRHQEEMIENIVLFENKNQSKV